MQGDMGAWGKCVCGNVWRILPCGHPVTAVAATDEGTNRCTLCAAEATA